MLAVVDARTPAELSTALSTLAGGIGREVDQVRELLLDLTADIEAAVEGIAGALFLFVLLAAVLAICDEARVGVVPQGGNTGLAVGSIPDDSGTQVVLSLQRLNAIRTIDAANLNPGPDTISFNIPAGSDPGCDVTFCRVSCCNVRWGASTTWLLIASVSACAQV